jgi:hypothetical protein
VWGSDRAVTIITFVRMCGSCGHQGRRRFTVKEDQLLRGLVCAHGLKQWELISTFFPDRTSRQCRERYEYYLAPNVYNAPWTAVEDSLLNTKVEESGTKWASLVRFFPGRTSNQLKNRWYTVLEKRRRRRMTMSVGIGTNEHPTLVSDDCWDIDESQFATTEESWTDSFNFSSCSFW